MIVDGRSRGHNSLSSARRSVNVASSSRHCAAVASSSAVRQEAAR